jgi:phosphoribosylanthranilate isomerase
MTKVKICGITNSEDARIAVEAGADLLGFIFYEPSPRYVTPEAVQEIVSGIADQVSVVTSHGSRITYYPLPQFIGVFVNAPLETVAHVLDYCQLDAAQLHGDESPEFVAHFQDRAFKALRPQSQAEAERLINIYTPRPHLPTSPPSNLPTFLIDAYHPTLYGGTGHVTDWTVAANIAQRHPIMLAGSLTPANVVAAIQAVEPWGIDVSSGVEREKGKKDPEKVRVFVEAVKNIRRKTQ